MKRLYVISDLQFGSCGKGLFAGYLAKTLMPDVIVTAWAPNAGHTFIDSDGRKFVNIALPNGIVSPNLNKILLGPGSVINPEQLLAELNAYADLGVKDKLMIHPHAAVVTQQHRDEEAAYAFKIGSTMKGVGEAVIQKIRRDPSEQNVAKVDLFGTELEQYVCTVGEYNRAIDSAHTGLLEGAQGFSLSMNQGFYPYTTSRDCTVTQLLSDCAIPFNRGAVFSYGVCRTYPIRVANRYDADGNQIGTSGPCYADQEELRWEDIGREPELTTVTKLPRRVFSWSTEQIEQAIRMNGVRSVFMNFVNYLPEGSNGQAFWQRVADITCAGASLGWVGHGPAVGDVESWGEK